MAILGILFSLGMFSYLSTRNPPRDAARTVQAALFTLRSQAMSNTQARRMVLVNGTDLVLQSALRCNETDQTKWTQIGTVPLDPGNGTLALVTPNPTPADPTVSATSRLVVCFTSRGLASRAGSLNINDAKRIYRVQVAVGGGIKTDAQ